MTGSSVAISFSSSACSALRRRPPAVFGPSGRWPAASTSTTRSGVSPSTAEATRLRIASGSPSASERWRSLSTTEALAGRSCSRNSESCGITRCTRADSTSAERAHRVLQLAFERALIVDLLVELRSDPVGLVEDLKSQPPALDAALGRGRQSRLVQLRRRNADARAIGGRLKWNLRLGQHLADLARIVGVEIGVESAPVGAQARTRASLPADAASSTAETTAQLRCAGCIPAQRTRPSPTAPDSRSASWRCPATAGALFSNCVPVAMIPAVRAQCSVISCHSRAILDLATSLIRSAIQLQNCMPITC